MQSALSSGQEGLHRTAVPCSHHNHCIDPCSPRRLGKDCTIKHAQPLREAHKRAWQSWPPRTPMPPPRGRSGEVKLRCPSTRNSGSLEHCRLKPSHAAHADVMATTQLVVRLMPAHLCRCQGKTRQRPVRSRGAEVSNVQTISPDGTNGPRSPERLEVSHFTT